MKFPTFGRIFRALAPLLLVTGLSVVSSHAQILYVSVNGGGTIQQVSSAGVVSAFASGLTAPKGLAFGPNGNLYVAQDFSGSLTSMVSQVTVPGGAVSNFATGLQMPLGVAFNTAGDLFVASYSTPLGILKVAAGSTTATTFSSGMNSPFGVAVNGSGTLFVANRDNGTISQVNMSDGSFTTFATGLSQPNDLKFNSAGDLFVSNFSAGTVSKITPGGAVSTFVTGLSSPVGLAFNPVTGALFVAQQGSNSIAEVALAGGSFTTFATGITGPQYLAFSPSAIPEPSTYAAIAGAAMLGVAVWRRRRAKPAGVVG